MKSSLMLVFVALTDPLEAANCIENFTLHTAHYTLHTDTVFSSRPSLGYGTLIQYT